MKCTAFEELILIIIHLAHSITGRISTSFHWLCSPNQLFMSHHMTRFTTIGCYPTNTWQYFFEGDIYSGTIFDQSPLIPSCYGKSSRSKQACEWYPSNMLQGKQTCGNLANKDRITERVVEGSGHHKGEAEVHAEEAGSCDTLHPDR